MEFAKAKKGLKKIYIAQIFAIIASVLSGGAAVFIKFFLNSYTVDDSSAMLVFGFAGFICSFIMILMMIFCIFLGLFGYLQAAGDEEQFKKAMICTVVSGALTIIGAVFKLPNGLISTTLTSAGVIFELFMMVFAVSGLMNIAEKFDRTDIVESGDRLLKVLTVIYIISALNTLVIRIFQLSVHSQTAAFIVGAVDMVLSVLRCVVFMAYLRKISRVLNGE